MAISRNQLVKELEPGLNALFGLEYKQYEQEHLQLRVDLNIMRCMVEAQENQTQHQDV